MNAANTAAETIVTNKLDGKKWNDDNLVVSTVLSGISGAAIGGINAANEFRAKSVEQGTDSQFQQDSTDRTQRKPDNFKSNLQKHNSIRHKNTKLHINNIWRNKIENLERSGAIFNVHRRPLMQIPR